MTMTEELNRASLSNPIARTAFMEAASDGNDGIHAVINVIFNRAKSPGWWGRTPTEVALCHDSRGVYQFSCWNDGSPTLAWGVPVEATDKNFGNAIIMSNLALRGALTDITNGADSYYREGTPEPFWARDRTPCAKVGAHLFYRVGLTGNADVEIPAPPGDTIIPAAASEPPADIAKVISANPGGIAVALKTAFSYATKNPAQWAAETTTLLGFALIGVAFWEYVAQALTLAQSAGIMTAGVGLLYPQSPEKAAATTTALSAAMEVLDTARTAQTKG